MGLETGSFVNDLVVTNPTTGDPKSQGDDHLRLLKTLLKATFPTALKAFYFPDTVAKTANYSVVAADMHKTILVDTTSGTVTLTMPSLVSGDAGWECSVIKTNTGTNPCLIAPPSGTIQSGDITGLATTRRCVPGVKTRVFWTGSAWIAERALGAPVGSVLDFSGTTLPVGYEWPNGQTLGSASTNYPDFYSRNGSSGVVLDLRGRVVAGKDNMGGSTAGRLTSASGITGTTFGASGGAETHTLIEAELPAVTVSGSISVTDPGHDHFVVKNTANTNTLSATNHVAQNDTTTYSLRADGASPDIGLSSVETTGITGTFSDTFGSDDPHLNVQPTIIMNKILVVE